MEAYLLKESANENKTKRCHMNIGIVILCRYNSSRLPGKILRKINGKTILEYIFERVGQVVPQENIVVATSEEITDSPIADFCIQKGYNCYRGSLNNVSLRFLNCAKEFAFDYVARINGDNLFADISSLSAMHALAERGAYNFISNLKNRTFPKGMSIEIVKTSYYEQVYQKFSSPEDFEHVTWYLYQHGEDDFFHYFNTECPEFAGVQLAIDTQDDFDRARYILNSFSEPHLHYGLKEIFSIYKTLKHD